jgi:WD40 repeat protein
MKTFQNENILKTIFASISQLRRMQIFNKINNTILSRALLKAFQYTKFWESLSKTKYILDNTTCRVNSLALQNNKLIVASDKSLKFWDISTAQCVKIIYDIIISVVVLPDGNIVYLTWGKLKVCNVEEDFKVIKLVDLNACTSLDNLLLLNNNKIAFSTQYCDKHCIRILDTYIYNCTKNINGHTNWIKSLIKMTENKFASGSADSTIKVWNSCDSYKCIMTLCGHKSWVISLAFAEKDNILLSGSLDKTVKVWNVGSGYNCINTVQAHIDGIKCLLLMPNGYFAFSGVDDNCVRIWNRKYENSVTLEHTSGISFLLLLGDYRIVSACDNGTIIIWG